MKHPKPLKDIRYFESHDLLCPGSAWPEYAGELWKMTPAAVALGQRIARKCEEFSVSISGADHLYICFVPAIPEGKVLQTDYGLERWHKFVMAGLASDYNRRALDDQLLLISNATFSAIEALVTEAAAPLLELKKEVLSKGSALRATLKTKETKKYRVIVEQDVPIPPAFSTVFVRIEELATSRSYEAQVAAVRLHDEAPSLVDRLSIVDEVLTIFPRKSFRADLIGRDYELPLKVDLNAAFKLDKGRKSDG